jgi:hypothetical protein
VKAKDQSKEAEQTPAEKATEVAREETQDVREVQLTGALPRKAGDDDAFLLLYRAHPGASAYWIGELLGWSKTQTKRVVNGLVESKHLEHDGNPEFLRLTPKGSRPR